MDKKLTEDQVNEALETCAAEPVHIPGTVQPFACLIGCSSDLSTITYASDTCETFLKLAPAALFGKPVETVLGGEITHQLRNAASRTDLHKERVSLGVYKFGRDSFEFYCFRSGTALVIELEPALDETFSESDALFAMNFLLPKLQNCTSQEELFEVSVDLIRHMTGFDRVLIYRFDLDFNGEVIAERQRASMPPYLGLRFPHWDIPRQAREIMKQIPIRIINDTNQTPQPLQKATPDLPELDITQAACRGVSEVHMTYLKNMGTEATLTLNVTIDDKLWGIISLHHRRPRLLPPKMRDLLARFVPLFSSKLLTLRQKDTLGRIRMLDSTLVNTKKQTNGAEMGIAEIAPRILKNIGADGIASINGDRISTFGDVPDPALLKEILPWANAQDDDAITTETLGNVFPDLQHTLRGCAGALVIKASDTKAICVFRNEVTRNIAWAGSPEKIAGPVSGPLRLSPRGSFSTFLEKVRGTCIAWSEDDVYFARHVRTLLDASETQMLLNKMNRQQSLMIDELNHRVRNILALVRSVSRQARRRYGSVDSYATAMESRIRALAASHELSEGSLVDPISLCTLIGQEFEPYGGAEHKIVIHGSDRNLRPDIAPIFSLVMHELSTNAAKYGALVADTGRVNITLSPGDGGLHISWKETGGPQVSTPGDTGFGTAMIEQAFPHEFAGTAQLTYEDDGVLAEFWVPDRHFDDEAPIGNRAPKPTVLAQQQHRFAGEKLTAPVLILEDNFIIAREMKDQILEFGAPVVEVFSNVADALDFLEEDKVSLGVLDINLGKDQNSVEVAKKLTELGVPFLFVSGYSEHSELPLQFPNTPLLTKPVSNDELQTLLSMLIL
ncbi:HWE histidine kinase domain-containing protein [Roseobacter sp.]|uniref:HWE histidine kinase domain-containing protein n=1 Tax=Roseobacter sp. TaxID=1907202 RepID=UPI00329688E1